MLEIGLLFSIVPSFSNVIIYSIIFELANVRKISVKRSKIQVVNKTLKLQNSLLRSLKVPFYLFLKDFDIHSMEIFYELNLGT